MKVEWLGWLATAVFARNHEGFVFAQSSQRLSGESVVLEQAYSIILGCEKRK